MAAVSPDELLWSAVQCGGLSSEQWELVVNHLLHQLEIFLDRPLVRDANAFIGTGQSFGFSVDFWSLTAVAKPLDFQVRGIFGGANYKGTNVEYVAVQGWLYPYICGQRTATTLDGCNHIFLRYARQDAGDTDWEMLGCTGPSVWRSLGWSADTYGEFGGLDSWH